MTWVALQDKLLLYEIPSSGKRITDTSRCRRLYFSLSASLVYVLGTTFSVWVKSGYFLRNLIDPRRWISKYSNDMTVGQKADTMNGGFGGELPTIPGATMTGINTFINRQGEEAKSEIEFSTYSARAAEREDTLPSSKHG